MSVITLARAKAWLNVIHNEDDDKIQEALDGAEREALEYMDRETFDELCETESEIDSDATTDIADYGMPSDVRRAIFYLLEADYSANPDQAKTLRMSAKEVLAPHRCPGKMGI